LIEAPDVSRLNPAALPREQDLWETIPVSEKRTKDDKAQRQADQLEKKESRRPAQPTREIRDLPHDPTHKKVAPLVPLGGGVQL
jgi:hypothetical protein